MYYNSCCGMPVSPCMPQPCPVYQQPVMPMQPYAMQQQAPVTVPMNFTMQQVPMTQPMNSPVTKQPEPKQEPCTTQTSYKKTTYMEAEVPLIQPTRAPYQTSRPARPTCTNLPIAQAYVQPQVYGNLSSFDTILDKGTFFNELYKPYQMGGKR